MRLIDKCLVALLVACIVVPNAADYWQIWTRRWDMPEFGNDFHLFYAASFMVLHGDYRCFEPPVMNYWCLQVTGGKYHAWPLYQTPFFILAFTPLALLDYYTATWVFLALNHLMLLGTAVLLVKALPWGETADARVITAWFLLSLLYVPINDTLVRGQLNIIVLFLLAAFVYALCKKRHTLASLTLSLAALVKIMPLLLLAVLGARRHWRTLVGALAFLLVFSGIALVAVPDLTRGFFTAVHVYASDVWWLGLNFPASQSYFSVFARWFFPRAGTPDGAPLWADNASAGTFLILFCAMLLWAVIALGLWKTRKVPDLTADWVAVVIAAIGCGVPYNWFHHHTWLLLPLILLWRKIFIGAASLRCGAGMLLCAATWMLFVADGPFYRGIHAIQMLRYYFELWGGGALAATILVGVGLRWMPRQP